MSVNPKYYYNLSGNISDGKKEYSLHHKEDKVGGLSISSGLKENHIEYGTNSLLDLLNELNEEKERLQYFESHYRDRNLKLEKENKELKVELESLQNKKNLSSIRTHKKIIGLMEENKELKQSIHDWQGSYDDLYEDNLKLEKENKVLKKQMTRLYNYFIDWHSDEMGGNQFSEMWDIVKESEEWEEKW